jgi:hypothetical protein
MTRLSPNETYKASVKSLKTNESKEMVTSGARLDFYMKHPDFLVTITSTYQKPVYQPIDRLAGTKAAAERKAEVSVS